MDIQKILNMTVREFINENENVNLLLNEEVWKKLPLINVNEVHNFKDGTLVRFRGMIQDMYGPEYYLEKFAVFNEFTKETSTKNGKYREGFYLNKGEKLDVDDDQTKYSERQCYVVTSVPGVNAWVQDLEKQQFCINLPPQTNSSPKKRNIDEVMDDCASETPTTSKKVAEAPKPSEESNTPENTPQLSVSAEHLINHPLLNKSSKVCHVKVYKEANTLKLNDVCDFVGFLNVSMHQVFQKEDDLESQLEIQTRHPPSSLVPRLHVVHFKIVEHMNPLADGVLIDNFNFIRKELLLVLTQLLMGDALAAEYLICNLLSEIYLRKDFMPLGKFSLNISNLPVIQNLDFAGELYKILQILLTKSHYLPMSLENINTLSFAPKKDYECNRLTSGILQLSKQTLLVLDETKLEEGKLDAAGVQNVKDLATAIKSQKVEYDFNYYSIEYECDIPFLILSEGKSMLPSDVHVPLKPDPQCLQSFSETLEAIKHFLKPELLNNLRKYLTQAKMIKYQVTDQVQDLVQEDFVNMRQQNNITADDLHSLLVLARLICLSEGKNALDGQCWRKACEMEKQRKLRLANDKK